MPRAKKGSTGNGSISVADLAELQAALASTLPKMAITAWPSAEWTRLALACMAKGYTVVISPQLDGRAVRVSVPVGTGRLVVTAQSDQELVENLRALTLQVEKLPPKD